MSLHLQKYEYLLQKAIPRLSLLEEQGLLRQKSRPYGLASLA
jgi:hypothetical protein